MAEEALPACRCLEQEERDHIFIRTQEEEGKQQVGYDAKLSNSHPGEMFPSATAMPQVSITSQAAVPTEDTMSQYTNL